MTRKSLCAVAVAAFLCLSGAGAAGAASAAESGGLRLAGVALIPPGCC